MISFKKLVALKFIICLNSQQSTGDINGHQDESESQLKVKAAAKNNAPSYRSSGDAACIQRNMDFIERGQSTDAACRYIYLSLQGFHS